MALAKYPRIVTRERFALFQMSLNNHNDHPSAFGYLRYETLLRKEEVQHNYAFEITYDQRERKFDLVIDPYIPPDDGEWDVNAWEAAQIFIDATPLPGHARDTFRDLSRFARGLLNGRTWVMTDGRKVNLDELRRAS